MNSFEAVKPGLPPGLWLPMAEESTEKYRTGVFDPQEFEDIVDYGAFVVAMAMLGQPQTGRVSLMPTKRDFDELYACGYGMSSRTLHRRASLTGLNRVLGFFSRWHDPTPTEVLGRFQWLADYGYYADPTTEKPTTIETVIHWGAARNLAPAAAKVYDALDGDTSPIRRMFGLEHRDRHRRYGKLDALRLGAFILAQHDSPIEAEEMNEKYSGYFVARPLNTIKLLFGNLTNFWLEFDRLSGYPKGIPPKVAVNLGVRWAIKQENPHIDTPLIIDLSHQRRLPNPAYIIEAFGSIVAYRAVITEAYDAYQVLRSEWKTEGIDPELVRAFYGKFETGGAFEQSLHDHKNILLRLSADTQPARYATALLRNGFDLLDEEIYAMQHEDFKQSLNRLGVRRAADQDFVLKHVPITVPRRLAASV